MTRHQYTPMASTKISVIIPTYNRQEYLCDILDSLSRQTLPVECYEVIVVDDGSDNGRYTASFEQLPYRLRTIRQANQGDAAARNTGARASDAELLVFLDDDMLTMPSFLSEMAAAHDGLEKRIISGTSHLWLKESNPLTEIAPELDLAAGPAVPIPFTDMTSNNVSLRRDAYFDIGMMTNLGFSGSSIWCDVDFAYRAHKVGYEFYRSNQAVCWHRDYVARSLENRTTRMKETAYRAAWLFEKHPELLAYIPMFDDKTPIAWGEDPPRLVARKVLRQAASSRPSLWGMEHLVGMLDRINVARSLRSPLQRWIAGGYLYRGYREGLSRLSE